MKRPNSLDNASFRLFIAAVIAGLTLPATSLAARRNLLRAAPIRAQVKRRPLAKPLLLKHKKVGWGPGEQMTFSARLGAIEAGRAALSVGKARRGGQEIVVRGRSESLLRSLFAFSEELLTRVDVRAMRPLHSTLKAQRGKRVTETRTQHRHGGISEQHIMRREDDKVRRGHRRRRLPAGHMDPFSAIFLLRSLSWEAGQRVELHVVSGRKSYKVEVEVKGRARVRTPGRIADCLQLRGKMRRISDGGRPLPGKAKTFTVWLSDDLARIPLKADLQSPWGRIKLELESYRPSQRAFEVGVPATLARGSFEAPEKGLRRAP